MRFGLGLGLNDRRSGGALLFPHDGRNYVYVPAGLNTILLASSFAASTSWSTAVAGRIRTAPPKEDVTSRFFAVGGQAFLDYVPGGGWTLAYRTAGGGYGFAGGVSPFAADETQDVGFMVTPTAASVYVRASAGDIDNQAYNVWTGWTQVGPTSSSNAAVSDLGDLTLVGAAYGSLTTRTPIYGAWVGIDGSTALLDPESQTESGDTLGPWYLQRDATGEKTRVVTAPVYA